MLIRLLLLVFELALIAYAVNTTIQLHTLKQRLQGLTIEEHPEVWLSRRERRAYARKLLRREDDEYTRKIVQQTMQDIQEGKPLA